MSPLLDIIHAYEEKTSIMIIFRLFFIGYSHVRSLDNPGPGSIREKWGYVVFVLPILGVEGFMYKDCGVYRVWCIPNLSHTQKTLCHPKTQPPPPSNVCQLITHKPILIALRWLAFSLASRFIYGGRLSMDQEPVKKTPHYYLSNMLHSPSPCWLTLVKPGTQGEGRLKEREGR